MFIRVLDNSISHQEKKIINTNDSTIILLLAIGISMKLSVSTMVDKRWPPKLLFIMLKYKGVECNISTISN